MDSAAPVVVPVEMTQDVEIAPAPAKKAPRKRSGGKRTGPKVRIGSKLQVWTGSADKTAGGLTKEDLMENERGKIVSKKMHANGRRAFAGQKAAALHKLVTKFVKHLNDALEREAAGYQYTLEQVSM